MFNPADFSGLEGLLFVARRLVDGLYAGSHASTHAGPGIEFHDYRTYCPGDDPAQIDWKLYGRTDRLFVRRHRWYTDFSAMVMLDCSASMDFAGMEQGRAENSPTAMTKLRYGSVLAAAIAFLTVKQADRVGMGMYSDDLVRHRTVGATWSHLHAICRMLETAAPVAGTGDAASGLEHGRRLLGRSPRSRGIVVLISDLLEDPTALFSAMNRLRHNRFEVICFQILTPDELDLNESASRRLEMVDLESTEHVRTDVDQIGPRYNELITEHLQSLQQGCADRGVDYNLLRTDQSVIEALQRYLSRRSAMRA